MDVAIIGAGRMGQGIAQAFASHDHTVLLVDQDDAIVETARERIRASLVRAQGKGLVDAASAIDRIQGCRLDAIPDCDLVIEAVFEDLDAKQAVFEAIGKLPPTTILASNTSSFPIADLAKVADHPDRILGLHFFYPAQQNPLVEVVATTATSADALTAAEAAVASINKTAIRVKDVPGFAINRFLLPLANEACRLVDEGHRPADVEASGAMAFGIAYGPFTVMDLSGATVCWRAQQTLHQAFGDWYEPSPSMERMGRSGDRWDVRGGIPDHALALRLRGAVFRAAQEMLEEGVASRTDADRGARLGLRWPMGPFELMELPGVEADVEAR